MCFELCTDFFMSDNKEYVRITGLNGEGVVEVRLTLPIVDQINKDAFILLVQKLNKLLSKGEK